MVVGTGERVFEIKQRGGAREKGTAKSTSIPETISKTPNQVFEILPGENVTLTSAQETAKKVGIVLQIWGKYYIKNLISGF